MIIIKFILLELFCIAIISSWVNAKNIDRVEKRVNHVEIDCEEVAKKVNSLKGSLKQSEE